MGVEETQAAIAAAAEAFKTWGRTTAKERHDILMRFYALLHENAEDLARIIVRATHTPRGTTRAHTTVLKTLENGKALAEAKVIKAC
jgi:succinate-semialdehyde dehydrogenase/glutarate-semialdehyde dehydrogenase